jgi:hypothetical protein
MPEKTKTEIYKLVSSKYLSNYSPFFDEESDYYIDINKVVKEGNLNDLFSSGTRVPQHIFSKIYIHSDPLESNICNN